MATQLHIPDDLLAELQIKAAAEGKTVDEIAVDALRKGLEERSWQDLLEYGSEKGCARNFREEEAGDLVRNWRSGR